MLKRLCATFGHQRSRRKARRITSSWRSECRLCGTPLVRVGKGSWMPVDDLRSQAEALGGRRLASEWPTAHDPIFERVLDELDVASNRVGRFSLRRFVRLPGMTTAAARPAEDDGQGSRAGEAQRHSRAA